MRRLRGFVLLMRPVNCFMVGLAVLAGIAIANPNILSVLYPNAFFGFITGFMLTAASMAINDYYDREIDAINEPNRPIPFGIVKPNEALIFTCILTATGFTTGYLTSISCFYLAILAWIFSVTYSTIGKRSGLPGNFLVSVCVAVPFIYGSVTAANRIEFTSVIFAVMAFLSNSGREITKGIVDVKGDRMKNVNTLAVRYGERAAARVAAIFYLLTVFLSPVPWLLNLVSWWGMPLAVVTDVGLMASSFMLIRDSSRENARKVKKNVLLLLIIGLFAFVIGTIK